MQIFGDTLGYWEIQVFRDTGGYWEIQAFRDTVEYLEIQGYRGILRNLRYSRIQWDTARYIPVHWMYRAGRISTSQDKEYSANTY